MIDVPAQTARHKYLAGNTKDSSRANSRSRARPVWSSLPASLPAAKEQSSATGARSPRQQQAAAPASPQLPAWDAQAAQEQLACRNPSRVCVDLGTRSLSHERILPASFSQWLDAWSPRAPPLSPPPLQQQLPPRAAATDARCLAEQMVQPPARLVGSTNPPAPTNPPATTNPPAAVPRDQTMDSLLVLGNPPTAVTPTRTPQIRSRLDNTMAAPWCNQHQPDRPHEGMRACLTRCPSMDSSRAQMLALPPQRMRGSLGGSLQLGGLRSRQ